MRSHCPLRLLLLLALGTISVMPQGCAGRRDQPSLAPGGVVEFEEEWELQPPSAQGLPSLADLARLPTSPSRWISKTTSTINGADTVAQGGARNRAEGSTLSIIPGSDDELAYAVYSQGGITDDKPVNVEFSVAPTTIIPGSDDELAVEFWVGLSNYTRYTWEWLGPFNSGNLSSMSKRASLVHKGTSAAFSLTLNSETIRERYVSRADGLNQTRFNYVVLVTSTNDPDRPNAINITTSNTVVSPDYFTNKPHAVPVFEPFIDNGGGAAGMGGKGGSHVIKRASSADCVLGWDHVPALSASDARNESFCYLVQRQARGSSTVDVLGMVLRDTQNWSFRDPPDSSLPDGGYSFPPGFPQFPIPDKPLPGTQYIYSLKAYNEDGWNNSLSGPTSTPSCRMQPVDLPIDAPEGIRTSFQGGVGTLIEWTPVEGAVDYDVYRRPVGASPPADFLHVSDGNTAFVDQAVGADLGQVFYYSVVAKGADADSAPSSEARGCSPNRIEADNEGVLNMTLGGSMILFDRVPAGTLMLGSPAGEFFRASDEDNYQGVGMSEYYICETEITNGMWASFITDGGNTSNDPAIWSDGGLAWRNGPTGSLFPPKWGDATKNADPVTQPSYPVQDVTWYEARAFANWLDQKYQALTPKPVPGAFIDLPTEAEWEYAAEGPTEFDEIWLFPWFEKREMDGGVFNHGNDGLDMGLCNSVHNAGFDNFTDLTAPFDSFSLGRSWCGALNMAGNVAEWTCEDYRATYPSVWTSLTVTGGAAVAVRGGGLRNNWFDQRTSHRLGLPIDSRGDGTSVPGDFGAGVRLVLVPST